MLRNYNENSPVRDFYASLYSNQSLEKERELRERYCKLNSAEMTMEKALNLMDTFIDPSDPDLDVPNSVHAYQTAERIRNRYPHDKQLQLTGLIHDLGKVLFNYNEPNYFIVGDTYVLGAEIPKSVAHYDTIENPGKYAEYGIYKPHCGLENLTLSWGHDEYLYQVLLGNKDKHHLDKKYMDIIRYHSFYPWHTGGSYMDIMSEEEKPYLDWVRDFNQYDLYTKRHETYNLDDLKAYYLPIIENYLGKEPIYW